MNVHQLHTDMRKNVERLDAIAKQAIADLETTRKALQDCQQALEAMICCYNLGVAIGPEIGKALTANFRARELLEE
jgi:hypothetical protein